MKLVTIRCPYCKTQQNVDVHSCKISSHPVVIHCNVDEYGPEACGKMFAMSVTYKPIVKLYSVIQTYNDVD
jgi:hypothetical protein